MIKKSKGEYQVESIVSVNERGQIVLPKELRKEAGIKSGDKLALVSLTSNKTPCCIFLFKAEEFSLKAKQLLGLIGKTKGSI